MLGGNVDGRMSAAATAAEGRKEGWWWMQPMHAVGRRGCAWRGSHEQAAAGVGPRMWNAKGALCVVGVCTD